MAKVKIKNLPEGFEVQNGKIVKSMKQGGSTGDQAGYSLRTLATNRQDNKETEVDVRYSLSSVPRDKANLEAEGGETVLTDLNNDGSFGLYDIKGPRHSKGGVPLFLPEQSFIFSDTPALKMGGEELEPYGVNSKNKMTPAQVSKKFKLNEFYAAMKDPFADEIQVRSAELMMDKNKRKLSRLAFDQEKKKNFEDGVPLAAHPFLVTQGIDPIEFTQQIEQLTEDQARQKIINSLPPEEQQKLMFLQQMLAAQEEKSMKAEQQAAMPEDQMMPDEQFPDEEMMFAKFGYELPMAQKGKEKDSSKKNIAVDPETAEYYKKRGIDINSIGIGESAYSDVQSQDKNYTSGFVYGDASKNIQGFEESWRGVYPEIDNLLKSIANQKGLGPNKDVEKFQNWFNTEYIPSQVKIIGDKVKQSGKEWNENQAKDLTNKLLSDYGFNSKIKGKSVDGAFGTVTSSKRPLRFNTEPAAPVEQLKKEEPTPPSKKLEVPEFKKPIQKNSPEFWLQDLLQLDSISQRERDMFFPWQPEVENTKFGYVLEEPTRAIAAINEQLNIANQAAGAFGGPQQLAARTAQNAANAAGQIADEIARVNQRNVSTINQGKAQQAQMDYTESRERRDRNVKEYDDTQKVLQTYIDEKNFDREQYAQMLGNAITNRANTYNLNSIQDYYQIDPSTGGVIGQFDSKAFEPSPIPDPMANVYNYIEVAKLLKLSGIEPKAELIQGMLGQPTTTTQESNAQKAYKNMPMGMGYNYYPGNYAPKQGSGKFGKEMKKYAVPFYIGKTGV